MLTYGTLFSGIDGFAVGFDRLGWDLRWQVEQDAFCLDVLRHHWPHVPKHTDVSDVGADQLERVDLIAGGFPCQDISLAGAGAGIDGARSGLWSEYARIVGELRPRYVIVENVSALLARGMGRVLGDLAALGYDAEWDCIPASAFGAPHQRDRLWIVAYPNEVGRAQGLCEPTGRSERLRPGDAERSGEHLADTDAQAGAGSGGAAEALHGPAPVERPRRRGGVRGAVQDADGGPVQPWRVGGRAAQAGGAEWWSVEPPVGRVAHGVPNRLDQLAALGNALVPQIPEWIGRRILDYESSVIA